jgi:hypothetical protein
MTEPSDTAPPAPPTRAERRRAFLREIAGIVLGVLIALSLGAVATAIGWRLDAAEARRALALELGEILGQGEERVRANACIEGRLDAIASVLDAAGRSGQLPPLGPVGNPPFRTWSTGVWDSTISADIASHMDRELLDNLSGAYEFVRLLNQQTAEETAAWTALYAMVGPGRATTPGEVAALQAALTRARMAHRMMLMGSVRSRQMADAFDLPYDRGSFAEHADSSLPARYCSPLPPPDGKPYGQAPFEGIYERMLANPISKDRRSGAGRSPPAPAEAKR